MAIRAIATDYSGITFVSTLELAVRPVFELADVPGHLRAGDLTGVAVDAARGHLASAVARQAALVQDHAASITDVPERWTVPGDRTVHASLPDGSRVVRYDRAGKWFHEPPTGPAGGRRITIAEAVRLTVDGGTWHPSRPGGLAFDARVRRAMSGER